MSQSNLEARVAQLEEQMAALMQRVGRSSVRQPGRDDWKTTIGMFDNDPIAGEVIDEALKIREEDRKRTRA